MQFDSLTYLLFLAVAVMAYRFVGPWHQRKNLLLAASYVFYAAWSPWFLPLLIITSTLDWWWSLKMARSTNARARRRWLVLILATNLGVLGYFKYSYFFTENLSTLASVFGWAWQASAYDIILPIGISFYTFHSLSYCIDIYRKKFEPVNSWRDYVLYVSFFPQLVAGPIVRWSEMREQIETPRQMSLPAATVGGALLVYGLFAKVVLADAVFAPVANDIFAGAPPESLYIAWLGALAFGGQIFCDFAGYSTCALGSALIFGFRLPINFLNPYAAVGFADFWRRWHISLSTWLRDYLYIGLGGNRQGRLKTYRNLMLTMLIGGLWHGAAWTFVLWGGLHGALLVLERLARRLFRPTGGLPLRLVLKLMTFCLITYTWVWFRSPDLSFAWGATLSMWNPAGLGSVPSLSGAQWLVLAAGVMLVLYQWLMNNRTEAELIVRLPAIVSGLIVGLLAALVIASPGDSHAFIYFQF